MAVPVKRPFGITLLEVYGFLVGVSSIATGILLLFASNDKHFLSVVDTTTGVVITVGIFGIVVGALQMLLAFFLGQANNVVRVIYAIIAAMNLASGLWAAVAADGSERATGVVTLVFAGLVLYLLFNHRADEYFEQQ